MDSSHEHEFIPAANPSESRAPCPALNALANHGYLPRTGKDISLSQLTHAITTVYNFSYALAFLLSFTAILRYGKVSLTGMKVDLASLSQFGPLRIAHQASSAHSDVPSHTPDPALVQDLLSRARQNPSGGLDLRDLAATRVDREAQCPKLDGLHEEIACGESALAYLTLKAEEAVIPSRRIQQWFGEERLPDGWWQNVRPRQIIGLAETRRVVFVIREMMTNIKEE
ncbi:hypothetical protein WG66_003754 [Moniliophthora roreri]|uniref:Heme haloperoxidase family profile domain-containing protein n=1 Tax=Moniliophthora roreri TaxID=221103 RepID=A0A0W0GEC2_MONRR|nr:hypothetical protein WG66_003754 [Moniliophthora roreri]